MSEPVLDGVEYVEVEEFMEPVSEVAGTGPADWSTILVEVAGSGHAPVMGVVADLVDEGRHHEDKVVADAVRSRPHFNLVSPFDSKKDHN